MRRKRWRLGGTLSGDADSNCSNVRAGSRAEVEGTASRAGPQVCFPDKLQALVSVPATQMPLLFLQWCHFGHCFWLVLTWISFWVLLWTTSMKLFSFKSRIACKLRALTITISRVGYKQLERKWPLSPECITLGLESKKCSKHAFCVNKGWDDVIVEIDLP